MRSTTLPDENARGRQQQWQQTAGSELRARDRSPAASNSCCDGGREGGGRQKTKAGGAKTETRRRQARAAAPGRKTEAHWRQMWHTEVGPSEETAKTSACGSRPSSAHWVSRATFFSQPRFRSFESCSNCTPICICHKTADLRAEERCKTTRALRL